MTPDQRKARGQRAAQYNDEFLRPILAENRSAYQQRIVEVATTDLDPKTRAEKLTALSVAIKILNNLESGIIAIVEDGKLADRDMMSRERVEKMGKADRRLLDIAPWR